ncbi:MAG: GNAT family N-acetyltransferase [Planctomycetes bacterium]|nr:GNAT family N-acetyltransferase [Planctomycetota bacterium]
MARIETVDAADREKVLACVLAPPGRPAPPPLAHVRSFARYIDTCGLEWVAWRSRRQRRETACLFILLLPGGTAIAMFPAPAARNIEPADQRQLMAAGLGHLADRKLHYVQALVEPQAADKRELLEASGFTHLTQLIYLQRTAASPSFERVRAHEAAWIAYRNENHSAFAQILLATYEDSRDCPELTDLRPIDAVIASHKAAGEFDPTLWEIACVGEEHAGCILLSRLTQGSLMEVVYLGVAPGWRGRGVGKLLLRRALERCRVVGTRELTAVVDRRNDPARQLYARFDFKPTAVREAYIHTW